MLHRIIAQRYRIEEHLGAGGMGDVWRATDLRSNETVALKRSFAGDPRQLSREMRIAAGLSHPNVVEALGTVTHDNEHWLVMEYLPSRSLAEILERDGPIGADRAARIGRQIAGVLAFLHTKNAVHRDVKPGNVLVTADDTAKLSDFGVARWSEITQTGGGDVAGTPGYLAPEVAAGHEATSASDVFALGATLFAAVEGTSPWGSPDAGTSEQLRRAKAYDLTPVRRAGPFTAVLKQLMARDPADRPAAENVAGLLDGTWTPPRFRRTPLLIGAAAVVVAVVVAGVILYPRFNTAGTVGDMRTMNVCGLASADSYGQFTKQKVSVKDTDAYYFNECATWVPFDAEGKSAVQVLHRVMLYTPFDTPPKKGELGQVEKSAEKDGSCTRKIALSDGNVLLVEAKEMGGPNHPLCDIADTAARHARSVLERGEIPRRDTPWPAGSLGSANACRLLTSAEIVETLRSEATPYAWENRGPWACSWDHNGRSIYIEFTRGDPLNPEDDGTPIDVGGRTAYLDADNEDNWPEACTVDIEQRVIEDQPRKRVEVASVILDQSGVADRHTLCDTTIKLAKALVNQLPPRP